jgi:hypothetical protein
LISSIRKDLLSQLDKPTYKNIFFLSIAYDILIDLAKKYPINDIDVFSRNLIREISTDRLIYVSTGHVYDIQGYLEYLRLLNSEEGEKKPVVKNINANINFNEFDLLHLNCTIATSYHHKNNALFAALLEKFALYIDLNEHLMIEFLMEKLNEQCQELLKEVCSYGLCLISKKYPNRMQLFDIFFSSGKFNPNELHHYSEDVSHLASCMTIVLEGKRVDLKSPEPMSLLRIAALHGNAEVVDYLIKNGANINLIYSTSYGHKKHVLFDVVHGEKVHTSKAVSTYGYGKVARLLLENGANIELKIEGMTAQSFASPSIMARIHYNLSYITNEGPFNIYAPQCKNEIEAFVGKRFSLNNHWQISNMRLFNMFNRSEPQEQVTPVVFQENNRRDF